VSRKLVTDSRPNSWLAGVVDPESAKAESINTKSTNTETVGLKNTDRIKLVLL